MNRLVYHLIAFLVVAVWGTTFVFTKLLLIAGLTAAQIFVLRFIVAYVLLFAYSLTRWSFRLFASSWKDELLMFGLGVTGGSLYFLTENSAMIYTTTTNTSLIVCLCPLFAALLIALFYRSQRLHGLQIVGSVMAAIGVVVVVLNGHFVLHLSPLGDTLAFAACLCPLFAALLIALFYRSQRLHGLQIVGSVMAAIGVIVVVLNGHFVLHLSPLGDTLAFAACLCWALYSLLMIPANQRYNSLFITRKVFFYGLLSMIPYFMVCPEWPSLSLLLRTDVLLNLLFLGCIASMLCYLLWNWTIKKLGAVVVTNYVYFNPVVTVLFAWVILSERITLYFLLGTLLILVGMFLSNRVRK